MAVDTEQRRKIHAAMDAAGGVGAKAAIELGMAPKELYNIIRHDDELRLRWSRIKVSPPPSEITLHRPPAPTVLANEVSVARAMEKEDALVRSGLENIGIKGEAQRVAMALAAFQRDRFKTAMEMLGGGVTKAFLDTMGEIDKINQLLGDPTSELDLVEEQMLREDRRGLLELLQKFYDRANQAVLVRAKVKAMEDGGTQQKGGKPGFSPLLIKAEGNVTIQDPSNNTRANS